MDIEPGSGSNKAGPSSSREKNESDYGSASSLYARINPRLKSRLPIQEHHQILEMNSVINYSEIACV